MQFLHNNINDVYYILNHFLQNGTSYGFDNFKYSLYPISAKENKLMHLLFTPNSNSPPFPRFYLYTFVFVYMCVCVCVCVLGRRRVEIKWMGELFYLDG